jgi:hypothetical protein
MGNLRERYNIYVSCAKACGFDIKTYDEWLNNL